jgi:hypothetical protein
MFSPASDALDVITQMATLGRFENGSRLKLNRHRELSRCNFLQTHLKWLVHFVHNHLIFLFFVSALDLLGLVFQQGLIRFNFMFLWILLFAEKTVALPLSDIQAISDVHRLIYIIVEGRDVHSVGLNDEGLLSWLCIEVSIVDLKIYRLSRNPTLMGTFNHLERLGSYHRSLFRLLQGS